MAPVVTSLDEITPDWLTGVLHRAGVLPQGAVLGVEFGSNPAFNSTITHLVLRYASSAPPTAPPRLVLKRNVDTPWAKAAGAKEAAFYQLFEGLPERLPMIARCYAAAHDAETGNSHVLLHDLSDTHHPALTRDQQLHMGSNMPATHDMEAIVDTLARFHARWWEHALIGTGILHVGSWWQDQAHYEHQMGRKQAAWTILRDAEQAWFPSHVQQLYEDALARLPILWERYLQPRLRTMRHLTVTHNDTYFANFLCPNDRTQAGTFIIDWQEPAVGRGADDVANLLTTFWTRTQRVEGQREARLLHRYYDGLCAHGVQGYRWEDFMLDYKVGVIEWLFVPVQDRADGAGKDYWWPKMQCLVAAFEDLDCAEVLGT